MEFYPHDNAFESSLSINLLYVRPLNVSIIIAMDLTIPHLLYGQGIPMRREIQKHV